MRPIIDQFHSTPELSFRKWQKKKQTIGEAKTAQLSVKQLQLCLVDEHSPIAKRMRCAFKLRQIGGAEAIDALASALGTPSVLLAHEIAFVLGQMQDSRAVPYLNKVLEKTSENAIVRHEAAEALGAIGHPESLEILRKYLADAAPEVVDTCRLAVARIEWKLRSDGKDSEAEFKSAYDTHDPAPAFKDKTVPELKELLLNGELTLFERYRAMFALRNRGSKDAVLALVAGFNDKGAVFRHEIAYVLGQLQNRTAIPHLKRVVEDLGEHAMVRHEAAEALGSIADDDVSCTSLLEKYKSDRDQIVSQSCYVALDIADYWAAETEDD